MRKGFYPSLTTFEIWFSVSYLFFIFFDLLTSYYFSYLLHYRYHLSNCQILLALSAPHPCLNPFSFYNSGVTSSYGITTLIQFLRVYFSQLVCWTCASCVVVPETRTSAERHFQSPVRLAGVCCVGGSTHSPGKLLLSTIKPAVFNRMITRLLITITRIQLCLSARRW